MLSADHFSAMPVAVLGFLAMAGTLMLSIISSYTKRIRGQQTIKKAMSAPPDYIESKNPESELQDKSADKTDENPKDWLPKALGLAAASPQMKTSSVGLGSDLLNAKSFSSMLLMGVRYGLIAWHFFQNKGLEIFGYQSGDEQQFNSFKHAVSILKKHFGPNGQYKFP